ncbi:MAG: hypothetical protein AB7G34_15085 [Hyphomicrobiales bacterium]
MAEPDHKAQSQTIVTVELADEPPVTESELELIETFLGDLIAELMSEVPEQTN